MTSPAILASRGWAVKLALVLAVSTGAASERLLLTDSAGEVPGWTRLPDLTARAWQPDVLLTSGSRTLEQAVDHLVRAVAAAPPADGWLRLDTIDLTAVGDCETCQPPPVDPHRYLADQPPARLQPRQYEFFDQAAAALKGSGLNPYVIVPPGSPLPPERPHPDLWFFLASPPPADALTPETLAARAEEGRRWAEWHVENRVSSLVTDGLDDLAGLPRGGSLLQRQIEALPAPAVVIDEPVRLAERLPEPLEQRLEAVVRDGARVPEADVYRLDRPDLARLLDIYLPCRETLSAMARLSAGTALARLDDLDRLAAWDRARAAGTAVAPWAGPEWFGESLNGLLTRAEPLKALDLPAIEAPQVDAWLAEDEWRGAAIVGLTRQDDGATSDRPATVRVGLVGERLYLAVVATEPNPVDASLRDRVVLMTEAAGEVREIALAVDGTATLRRAVPGEERLSAAERVPGAAVAATFDGPGWVLEASLPLAVLGRSEGSVPMNVRTEHRAGRERWTTVWQPTGGGLHHPLRLGRWRLDG